jgi:hypothetical protein
MKALIRRGGRKVEVGQEREIGDIQYRKGMGRKKRWKWEEERQCEEGRMKCGGKRVNLREK